ncbi:sugar transporter [Vibrio alfacsensis]|uniref:sugar transporter n=1 Tax=Vibrio alfacsensis TaxID=1074311 RepID=UPI001BED9C4A|nr:sugar transporter [Vibrio alfacsensis]BCN23598.1 sugar transporter [Vibrio alfacsensis]
MSTNLQFAVGKICSEALFMVRANLLAITIACIPLIVVHVFFITQYQSAMMQAEPNFSGGFFFTTLVLYPLVAAMAAVRIHRIYLAHEYMQSALDVVRLSMRELRFIGWWILFGISMIVTLGLPLFTITFLVVSESGDVNSELLISIITLISSIPAYWLLSRWSLVLPATALDHEPRGLAHSWRKSRPYKKQIFILMGVIPLLAGTVSQLVFAQFSHIGIMLVSGLLFGVFGAYQIALLSLSYRTIVDIERSRFSKESEPQQNNEEFPA